MAQALPDLSQEQMSEVLDFVQKSKINITEETMLERLSDRYRWPQYYNTGAPTIERIVQDDGLKAQDFFLRDRHIDREKFFDFYNQGYTFVVSAVQYLFNDITNITEYLSNIYQTEINSNIYISKGKKIVSYPYHDHEYSVIIKNIYGKSKWLIDDKEERLENQNIFFVPKGTYHAVKEIEDIKLSITFNLHY